LSSCAAPVWYKSNQKPGEFEQDKYSCIQQSQQQMGVAQVNVYGGTAVNQVVTNNSLFNSCMNSRGWSLHKQENAQALEQQRQFVQADRNTEIKNAFDNLTAQLNAVCIKPELKEYYAKSSCRANEVTFSQLADDTKITSAQKAILTMQRDSSSEIIKIYKELQIKYFGEIGRKRVDLSNSFLEPKNDDNNLDLYNGKITWGEYNKRRRDISNEYQNKIKDIR
jgi:hypothetical protein